jgi:hypothetical protein
MSLRLSPTTFGTHTPLQASKRLATMVSVLARYTRT